MIAGTIVRYSHIANELTNRKSDFTNVVYGIKRFTLGLAKKVPIANNAALVADRIFELAQ